MDAPLPDLVSTPMPNALIGSSTTSPRNPTAFFTLTVLPSLSISISLLWPFDIEGTGTLISGTISDHEGCMLPLAASHTSPAPLSPLSACMPETNIDLGLSSFSNAPITRPPVPFKTLPNALVTGF